jgi:hypothetical protein
MPSYTQALKVYKQALVAFRQEVSVYIQAVPVSVYTQAMILKGYPRNGCLYMDMHVNVHIS